LVDSALLAVVGYLIGSVSFAVVVSRTLGLPDPHTYGSRNPGATNVLRTGNKKAAVYTLLGDASKGMLAIALARYLVDGQGTEDHAVAAVALAAFVGHLYPVYFGFKGGKGVATAAGILFALDWRLGLGVLAVWFLVAIVTRYSSLAALVSAIAAPALAWWLLDGVYLPISILAMALLLVMRHAGNIRKLLAGNESRIRLKS
jgi:acyl phosphate:glycerol-3-phosphate acyltransferase